MESIWSSLSQSVADTISAVEDSVVTVHGGGRATSSGVVWRPGVVVTVRHGLRRTDALLASFNGEAVPAKLAGADAGTDLAVLRLDGGKPVTAAGTAHIGEVVLAVGRSGLGDISASAGIIARLGSAWRTWRGGQIDRLIRPDVRLYVGQSGSALVNGKRQVIGINSAALARDAVITIPASTIDRVVDAILERGHVPRPYLGAAMQAVPVPEASRPHFAQGVDEALLVLHVEPNAPAAAGGILVGDLLLSINKAPAASVHQVQHLLAGLRAGDPVAVVVIRGGVTIELAVTLADRG